MKTRQKVWVSFNNHSGRKAKIKREKSVPQKDSTTHLCKDGESFIPSNRGPQDAYQSVAPASRHTRLQWIQRRGMRPEKPSPPATHRQKQKGKGGEEGKATKIELKAGKKGDPGQARAL